jgi:hypothetical protein
MFNIFATTDYLPQAVIFDEALHLKPPKSGSTPPLASFDWPESHLIVTDLTPASKPRNPVAAQVPNQCWGNRPPPLLLN